MLLRGAFRLKSGVSRMNAATGKGAERLPLATSREMKNDEAHACARRCGRRADSDTVRSAASLHELYEVREVSPRPLRGLAQADPPPGDAPRPSRRTSVRTGLQLCRRRHAAGTGRDPLSPGP